MNPQPLPRTDAEILALGRATFQQEADALRQLGVAPPEGAHRREVEIDGEALVLGLSLA